MIDELRAQYVAPDPCEPIGLWHVVEIGRLRALCGHAVCGLVGSAPLADLAGIDPTAAATRASGSTAAPPHESSTSRSNDLHGRLHIGGGPGHARVACLKMS